jgi:outer membrane protein assembly factor BamB
VVSEEVADAWAAKTHFCALGNPQRTGVLAEGSGEVIGAKLCWQADDKDNESWAVADGSSVFIAGDDEGLECLRLTDGQVTWRWSREADDLLAGSAIVVDDKIYCSGADGFVYQLRNNGRMTWSRSVSSGIETSMLYDQGRLYVASRDGSVCALDAQRGDLIWEVHTENPIESPLSMAGALLYAVSYEGHVTAFDSYDGAVMWTYQHEDEWDCHPVTDGGLLFLSHVESVEALDARTGERVWAFSPEDYLPESLSVSGPHVFVACDRGYVTALSRDTGKVLWMEQCYDEEHACPPVIVGSTVLACSDEGHLAAFDCFTGENAVLLKLSEELDHPPTLSYAQGVYWLICTGMCGEMYGIQLDVTGSLRPPAPFDPENVRPIVPVPIEEPAEPTEPATELADSASVQTEMVPAEVEEEIPYATPLDEPSVPVDQLTPQPLPAIEWQLFRADALQWTFDAMGSLSSPCDISGNTAFFGNDNGLFFAVDLRTGTEVWRYDVGSAISSPPSLEQSLVVFGAFDSQMYALHVETGECLWTHSTGQPVVSRPVMHKGLVLYGSSGLCALERDTGVLCWRMASDGDMVTAPAIAMELAIFGSDDCHVYAVNVETGKSVWRFATQGKVRATPAVCDDTVFVASTDKKVYALDILTGEYKWSCEVENPVVASLRVWESMIILGDTEGYIYALNA